MVIEMITGTPVLSFAKQLPVGTTAGHTRKHVEEDYN